MTFSFVYFMYLILEMHMFKMFQMLLKEFSSQRSGEFKRPLKNQEKYNKVISIKNMVFPLAKQK